ncbi:alpha/beta hydrolase [Dyadobacter diqingensis]|uniref:alpha/beta hydrolase n=1 Tax=Dyadobacter diqingensis TaxID=2938121 RepID=UPI0020C18C09|nr:alpha/beta hydrolase [Dyadobacter diqingensis]
MIRSLQKILLILILTGTALMANAQADTIPVIVTYKTIDSVNLQLRIFNPAGFDRSKSYPAVVFFFGGGWINGNISQFQKQAIYLASRGMVTILADYRVSSRHHTTPFEAVADGKSAVRYLRQHHAELGIDPLRIAAAGGSAGGHVAAATDLTTLDAPSEDRSISSRPNALVLFNPVFNNGPGEYGYDRIGDRYQVISPYHNIVSNAAPTIVFLGTKDKLVSVSAAEAYKTKMTEAGNRCELFLYPNQVHGFFNKGESFIQTLRETDIFLESLGYIKGKPTL